MVFLRYFAFYCSYCLLLESDCGYLQLAIGHLAVTMGAEPRPQLAVVDNAAAHRPGAYAQPGKPGAGVDHGLTLPHPGKKNAKGSDFPANRWIAACPQASRPPPTAAPRQGEAPPDPRGGLRPPPRPAERRRGTPSRSVYQVENLWLSKAVVKEKFLCIGEEWTADKDMTLSDHVQNCIKDPFEPGRGTRAQRGAGCGACGPANGVQRPPLAAGGKA